MLVLSLLEFTVSAAVSVFTYKVIFPSTPEVRVRKTNSSLSIHHSLFLCSVCLTPVAANRLSMKYERHDFSQRFLANLTMRNKTRVLSFTVTRANIEILPRPFKLRNLRSAYINTCIPVILRPNSSVYDLQKLRYRCAGRAILNLWAATGVSIKSISICLLFMSHRSWHTIFQLKRPSMSPHLMLLPPQWTPLR